MPVTKAQQTFVVGSSIAGIIAGLVLANRWANLDEVPSSLVGAATTISIIATVGAGIYLASKVGG